MAIKVIAQRRLLKIGKNPGEGTSYVIFHILRYTFCVITSS